MPFCTLDIDNDDMQTKVYALAESDAAFNEQLVEDEFLRNMFWYWMWLGHKWKPAKKDKIQACSSIDNTVAERIELVIALKLRLVKCYDQLNVSLQETMKTQIDEELGFMVQWLKRDMPNYLEIRERCLEVLHADHTDHIFEDNNNTKKDNSFVEHAQWTAEHFFAKWKLGPKVPVIELTWIAVTQQLN